MKRLREGLHRHRAWVRQAGQVSLAAWTSTAFAFFGTVVAARELGLDAFGEVVLAAAICSGVATLLDLTLDEAIVHHGALALEAGDLGGLRAMVRKSLVVDGVCGVLVAAIVIGAADPLAEFAGGGELSTVLVRLGALQLLVATLDSTTGATLLLCGRPELRAWAMASQGLTRLVGVVVAVQFGGAEAVMIAWIFAAAIASILQGFLAWRYALRPWARLAPEVGVSPVSTRRLLRFGMHTSFSTSVSALHQTLFQVLLGRLGGVEAVGIFKVALLPVTIADTLSSPIRMIVLPQQARLAAQDRYRELRRAMTMYTVFGLAASAAGCVIGWFALPYLIPFVYGDSFDSAVTPARILMIAAVSHFAFGWCGTFHPAIGRPELRTFFSSIVAVISLGMLGAARRSRGDRRGDRVLGRRGGRRAGVHVRGLSLLPESSCPRPDRGDPATGVSAGSAIPRPPFFQDMLGGLRMRAAATLSTAVGAVAIAGGEPLADTIESRLRETDRHAGVAVLYHVIGERPGDPRRDLMPAVGRDAFATQLDYLRRRFDVVPASELPAAAAAREPGERFPVAITFDDNARSNVELAARRSVSTGCRRPSTCSRASPTRGGGRPCRSPTTAAATSLR